MISPRQALNFLYFMWVKEMSEEDRNKFDTELYSPMRGETVLNDILHSTDE